MRKLVLRVGENGEEFGIMMVEGRNQMLAASGQTQERLKMWYVNEADGMTICLTNDVEKAMEAFLSII